MSNERPRRRRRTKNAAGDSKGEIEASAPQVTEPNAINLNSKAATDVAEIIFHRAQQYNFPIVQFDCHNCLAICQFIRDWLRSAKPEAVRSLIRIEDQKLDLVDSHTKGTLMLLESAATLNGNPSAPISVLSLYIPEDKHIRYFWTLMSPTSLLIGLHKRNLLGPAVELPYFDNPPARSKDGQVLPSRHHTLFTFLSQSFLAATTFPHSTEYQKASQICDVCPSILEPDTAYHRIDTENELHISSDTSKDGADISDDRYILELPSPERALTSLVYASCAEYLLIKRQYFKAFSRETVLHAHKVRRASAFHENQRRQSTPAHPVTGAADGGNEVKEEEEEDSESAAESTPMTTRARARSSSMPAARAAEYHTPTARSRAAHTGAQNRALRVRTKNAHARAVEAQTGWSFARAKKLVRGWEILGFLDEERVLAVLDGKDNGESSDEE